LQIQPAAMLCIPSFAFKTCSGRSLWMAIFVPLAGIAYPRFPSRPLRGYQRMTAKKGKTHVTDDQLKQPAEC
jgi:hypothetical protein